MYTVFDDRKNIPIYIFSADDYFDYIEKVIGKDFADSLRKDRVSLVKQIESLENEVSELNNEVEELNNDLDSLYNEWE